MKIREELRGRVEKEEREEGKVTGGKMVREWTTGRGRKTQMTRG